MCEEVNYTRNNFRTSYFSWKLILRSWMHFAMQSKKKNIVQYSRGTTCGLISHTNLQKTIIPCFSRYATKTKQKCARKSRFMPCEHGRENDVCFLVRNCLARSLALRFIRFPAHLLRGGASVLLFVFQRS